MSARLYQLLAIDTPLPGPCRRRVWMSPDVPLIVGAGVILRVLWDRQDWFYLPRAILHAPQANCPYTEQILIAGEWLDFSRWCGMAATTRAIERDRQERPLRYLLEFVAVSGRTEKTGGRDAQDF